MHVFPPLFYSRLRPDRAPRPLLKCTWFTRKGAVLSGGVGVGRWCDGAGYSGLLVLFIINFLGEIRGNTHIERDHTPRLPLFHYSLSVSPSYPALSYPALSKATRANPHGSLPPSTPCSIPFSLSSAATSPACGACSPREHTSMCLIANWGPAYGEARGGPASAAGRRRRGAVARPPQCRTGGSPPRWVRHGGRAGG